MHKTKVVFILLLFIPFFLFAQEEPDFEPDWEIYESDSYTRGDQTFNISLGTILPTVFINNGKSIDHNFSPPIGGAGSLSYNRFINSRVYIGGELSGMFNSTLGGNTVYIIPIGLRVGYQFNWNRFDFPVNYTIGFNWHRYLDETYFGLYMKLGGAAFYRVSQNWSFGANLNWGWYPQWTSDSSKDVHGNILDLTLCARYHF